MGYLYMTIVLACWTVIAFVYRLADRKHAHRLLMTTGIGLSALLLNAIFSLASGTDPFSAHYSQFIIGGIMGLTGIAGIMSFMAAVARGPISITWTVLSLSFASASALSLIFPGERPSMRGVLGLVLAAVAVTLLGLDMRERRRGNGPGSPKKGWGLYMVIAFLTNSVGLYCFTLANHFAPDASAAHKFGYLLAMYGTLGIGSLALALLFRKGGKIVVSVGIGAVAGMLLFGGGFFALAALKNAGVPAYVFYPATSGGSTILVVAVSVLILGEYPTRLGWTGLASGLIALILLSAAA